MSSSDDNDNNSITNKILKYIKSLDVKEIIVLLIFGFILFIIFKMMFGGIFGLSLVVIENGPHSSMWPTYDQGDMFVIYKCKPDKISLGDVIVYESDTPLSRGTLIIHRVINITVEETANNLNYYFRVSGDNPDTNNYVDNYNSTSTLIPYHAVLGKTILLLRKIGYLRLWLANNPVIRYILLFAIVLVGAYLILSPDKKKEEKKAKNQKIEEVKQKETKTLKERFKEYSISEWKNTKKWFIELFTVKKKRIILITLCSIILLLVILIPVIDNAIRVEGITTGISDITLLSTPAPEEDFVYVPFTIYFNQDGSWNQVLKSFKVEGIQNGTVLATAEWRSFYQLEGAKRIGGSLIFSANQFNNSLAFTIKISYTIKYRFGKDHAGLEYEETFLPPFYYEA